MYAQLYFFILTILFEMSADPAEKEIRSLTFQEITQIKKQIHSFKQNLSNISTLPRELLIRRIYLTQINDFFNSISFGAYEIKKDALDISGSKTPKINIDAEIESVIKNIQITPTKKENFIKKFLSSFTSISEQDRTVMLNTLLDLPEMKLRQDLKELTLLFPNS